MKLKFLGLKQQGKVSGCASCGARRVSNNTFLREKRMTLISGKRMTFIANQVYDMSSRDAEFLLGQTYLDNGIEKHAFEKV